MKVMRATLQCHLTLTCDYFDALGLSVLVMGKICSWKTNLSSDSHVWTSARNDLLWKRREKGLWAWPLYWSIIFGHPLLRFGFKSCIPKALKKLKFKCPDMRNGIDLRRCPHTRSVLSLVGLYCYPFQGLNSYFLFKQQKFPSKVCPKTCPSNQVDVDGSCFLLHFSMFFCHGTH